MSYDELEILTSSELLIHFIQDSLFVQNIVTREKPWNQFETTRITECGRDPRTCLDNLIDGFQSREMLCSHSAAMMSGENPL